MLMKISDYGPPVRSLRTFVALCDYWQWMAAICAALPTANAGQYATSHCKPLLFWFPRKRRYVKCPDPTFMHCVCHGLFLVSESKYKIEIVRR